MNTQGRTRCIDDGGNCDDNESYKENYDDNDNNDYDETL